MYAFSSMRRPANCVQTVSLGTLSLYCPTALKLNAIPTVMLRVGKRLCRLQHVLGRPSPGKALFSCVGASIDFTIHLGLSCFGGHSVNKLKTTPTPNKNGSYGIKWGSVCHIFGVRMPYFL